jgi:hypothetical protein
MWRAAREVHREAGHDVGPELIEASA